MKKYKDNFGNTAKLEEKMIFPYKGANVKSTAYVLTISADYDNDFVYFVSVYETYDEALEKLRTLSCGTFKLENK